MASPTKPFKLPARVVRVKVERDSKRRRCPNVSAKAMRDASEFIPIPFTLFSVAVLAKPSAEPQRVCSVRLFTAPVGARERSLQGAAESTVYSTPAASGPAMA